MSRETKALTRHFKTSTTRRLNLAIHNIDFHDKMKYYVL